MDVETEIRIIKARVEFLTKAYLAGLIINTLSFLGILITVITFLFK